MYGSEFRVHNQIQRACRLGFGLLGPEHEVLTCFNDMLGTQWDSSGVLTRGSSLDG